MRVAHGFDRGFKPGNQSIPAIHLFGETLDIGASLVVSRCERESLEITLEGHLGLTKAFLEHAADFAEQLDLRFGLLRVSESDLENGDELARVVRLLVDRCQCLGRTDVVRIGSENLLVDTGGSIGFALLVFPKTGRSEEELDLVFGRGLLCLRLALDDANELVPLFIGRVEAFELIPGAQRNIATLELLLRSAIVGIQLEKLLEGTDRALVVPDLVGVNHAELLKLLLHRRDVGVRRDERFQHVGERLPLASAFV